MSSFSRLPSLPLTAQVSVRDRSLLTTTACHCLPPRCLNTSQYQPWMSLCSPHSVLPSSDPVKTPPLASNVSPMGVLWCHDQHPGFYPNGAPVCPGSQGIVIDANGVVLVESPGCRDLRQGGRLHLNDACQCCLDARPHLGPDSAGCTKHESPLQEGPRLIRQLESDHSFSVRFQISQFATSRVARLELHQGSKALSVPEMPTLGSPGSCSTMTECFRPPSPP